MSRTGAVGWGKQVVYAFLTSDGRTVQLRLSVDEADRLDVIAGQRVRVTLPGREASEVLVTAVNSTPPYVWVELTPMATSRVG